MNYNGDWDLQKIRGMFSDQRDVVDISKIFFSFLGEDRRIWTDTKNGELTTKSAYKRIIIEDINPQVSDLNWKSDWKTLLPLKFCCLVENAL